MAQKGKTKIHLFGEMDLDLTDTPKNIYKEAFRIAECCGYMVSSDDELITIHGSDLEIAKIYFKKDKVTKAEISEDDGENWEQVDGVACGMNEESFIVTAKTLANYNKKIKYGTEQSLPFMQGHLINNLIKTYKIPAIRWGYHFNLVGIETKMQFMIWKDLGHEAHFLGLINKDGSSVEY